MSVVTKHSILFGISLIVNQGFTATEYISSYLEDGGMLSFIGDVITVFTITLDCTVNVIVLSLLLRANYNKYMCLCKWCHIRIWTCCFKDVDINEGTQNPYESGQDSSVELISPRLEQEA